MTQSRMKRTGFTRLMASFGNSFKGFRGCFREEAAFRQELALALVIVPLGLYLGATPLERIALVVPMALILIVEILNSAIEAAIDRISADQHPLSGLAKDLGSAAVMMAFLILAFCWAVVLLPRL
jgi:diacylglycerol kinase (ATP)